MNGFQTLVNMEWKNLQKVNEEEGDKINSDVERRLFSLNFFEVEKKEHK